MDKHNGPLLPVESRQVYDIARQIVKEETEAMVKAEIKDVERIVKALETRITDLEMELKDLKAEINRAKEAKDQSASETPKTHKKGVFK